MAGEEESPRTLMDVRRETVILGKELGLDGAELRQFVDNAVEAEERAMKKRI